MVARGMDNECTAKMQGMKRKHRDLATIGIYVGREFSFFRLRCLLNFPTQEVKRRDGAGLIPQASNSVNLNLENDD
jgi:hypothetical protein